MTYYLTTSDRRFRLPFPFASRESAERHRERICSQGDIVEVCEPVHAYRTVGSDADDARVEDAMAGRARVRAAEESLLGER